MKNKFNLAVIFFTMLIILIACKKESSPVLPPTGPMVPPEKDYAKAVYGRTWWGTFAYPGELAQYYSVSFKKDSTMIFYQMSGAYIGNWSLSANQLIMEFPVQSVIITADLSAVDTLMNFTTNNNVTMIDGRLQRNLSLIELEGTKWMGSIISGANLRDLVLQFSGGYLSNSISMPTDTNPFQQPAGSMAMYAVGPALLQWFGLIINDSTMIGELSDYSKTWTVKKH